VTVLLEMESHDELARSAVCEVLAADDDWSLNCYLTEAYGRVNSI